MENESFRSPATGSGRSLDNQPLGEGDAPLHDATPTPHHGQHNPPPCAEPHKATPDLMPQLSAEAQGGALPSAPASPIQSPSTPAPSASAAATLSPNIPQTPSGFKGFAPPEVYDPAEYRWVPVRRQPRYDGWTEDKQRRFIEALADTGIVGLAAKAVGMTREGAYRLRRSEHGAGFAKAWDVARAQAGALIEDIAFERAIEGVEHNIYDENGEVVCTKRVFNDRLLMFLLRNLNPERYGRDTARSSRQSDSAAHAEEPVTLDATLRAMEPQLPAPVQEFLDEDDLNHELLIADIADGDLPDMFWEQRREKTPERLKAEAMKAQYERGKTLAENWGKNGSSNMTKKDWRDMCLYMDPAQRHEKSKKRYR